MLYVIKPDKKLMAILNTILGDKFDLENMKVFAFVLLTTCVRLTPTALPLNENCAFNYLRLIKSFRPPTLWEPLTHHYYSTCAFIVVV